MSIRTPDAFNEFLGELSKAAPEMAYRWTAQKQVSADWIIDRIDAGKSGVDIGGTDYLVRRLREKGADTRYFDLFPSDAFPDGIQDDMLNVMDHFEPRSLDFITMRHALEHSLVPLFQLWCFNKLLKDDGRLYLILPENYRKWIWFGTHFSCLPRENWLMLFYRAGFRVVESATGTWKPNNPKYVEHRFALAVESRELRLSGRCSKSWWNAAKPTNLLPEGFAVTQP